MLNKLVGLLGRFRSVYGSAIVATLGIAALAFLANIGLARIAGPEFYGSIILWVNWGLFLAAFGTCGMPTLMLRTLSGNEAEQEEQAHLPEKAVALSLLSNLVWSLPFAAIVLSLPNHPDLSFWAFWATTLAFAIGASSVRVGAMILRARGKTVWAVLLDQGWRPVTLLLLIAVILIEPPTFRMAVLILSVAAILAMLGIWRATRMRRINPRKLGRETFQTLFKRGFPFWLTNFASNLMRRSDILILGTLLGPATAAIYIIAFRFAELPALLSHAINIVMGPRFSGIAHQKDRRATMKLLREHMIVSLALSIPAILVLFVAAEPVLRLVGPEYAHATLVFRILLIATLINLISRGVVLYLSMSGHETVLAQVQTSLLVMHLILLTSLTLSFGILGAAFARLIGLVLARGYLFFAAFRLLKITSV